MTPRCYDREPFKGQWQRNGYRPPDLKPKLRWRPHLMDNTCKAWTTVGDSPSVPEMEGWECGGCRWKTEDMR